MFFHPSVNGGKLLPPGVQSLPHSHVEASQHIGVVDVQSVLPGKVPVVIFLLAAALDQPQTVIVADFAVRKAEALGEIMYLYGDPLPSLWAVNDGLL